MALELLQKAYDFQMRGDYRRALNLYQYSIELNPTPEAYTFLGWTYGVLGKYKDAIRSCVKAIRLDPAFGNPYNDIGAYLIELGHAQDAIFWLECATKAPRYDYYEFPWYNLGRVYEMQGNANKAASCYQRALKLAPGYALAKKALQKLIAKPN